MKEVEYDSIEYGWVIRAIDTVLYYDRCNMLGASYQWLADKGFDAEEDDPIKNLESILFRDHFESNETLYKVGGPRCMEIVRQYVEDDSCLILYTQLEDAANLIRKEYGYGLVAEELATPDLVLSILCEIRTRALSLRDRLANKFYGIWDDKEWGAYAEHESYPFFPAAGIVANVANSTAARILSHTTLTSGREVGAALERAVRNLAREWPDGIDCGPLDEKHSLYIVTKDGHKDGHTAYFSTRLKWHGEYGDNRLRLLNWMIERLESECETY